MEISNVTCLVQKFAAVQCFDVCTCTGREVHFASENSILF